MIGEIVIILKHGIILQEIVVISRRVTYLLVFSDANTVV